MHDLMVSQKKDIEKAVDYFDSASFGDGTTDLITKMMPSVVTRTKVESQSFSLRYMILLPKRDLNTVLYSLREVLSFPSESNNN